jgi:hypothetical protein
MSVHLTDENGFSSSGGLLPTPVATPYGTNQSPSPGAAVRPSLEALLKTPTAQLAVNSGSQHPDKRRAGGHGPTLADQVEHDLLPTPVTNPDRPQGVASGSGASLLDNLTGALLPTPTAAAAHDGQDSGRQHRLSGGLTLAGAMLPTPKARDWRSAEGPGSMGRHAPDLSAVEQLLLPTPKATDGTKGGPNQRGSSGDLTLPSAVMLFPTATVSDSSGSNPDWGHGKTLKDAAREVSVGEPTGRLSAGGKGPSGGQHPRLPS